MQDLSSEFSKIFRGWYPRTLTAGGSDLLPHPTPSPAFGLERGAKRPGVVTQTLVPLNFSAVVAFLAPRTLVMLVLPEDHEQGQRLDVNYAATRMTMGCSGPQTSLPLIMCTGWTMVWKFSGKQFRFQYL